VEEIVRHQEAPYTSMATRVLILNVHSSSNAGDAALAYMTLELLKGQFPDLHATLSMDDPASHSAEGQAVGSLIWWLKTDPRAGRPRWKKWNLYWLLPATLLPVITYRLVGRPFLALTPRRLRGLVEALIRADLVVSEAGGFLYHSGSGLTLFIALYSLILAILAGKALYIFPQSIGPFKKKWQCSLAGWVLNRARLVMLREPISLEQVKNCGVKAEKCLLLPDLAFGFQSAPLEKADAWLAHQGIDASRERPLLGITVINWGAQNPTFTSQSEYETALVEAVSYYLDNYGGSVVFIPQVWGPLPSQDDRLPARRIQARLEGYPGRVHLVEEPLPPELLKAVYGRMDLFIGTRMHSNIFALSEGVPVIAIGYQHKTQGIARSLGLEEWVLDISHIDGQRLAELIRKLCERAGSLRKQIQAQMPAVVEQSRKAGQIVAADYARLKSGARHG
jgi:colanic acid/amylovoran biosynthesis protein